MTSNSLISMRLLSCILYEDADQFYANDMLVASYACEAIKLGPYHLRR